MRLHDLQNMVTDSKAFPDLDAYFHVALSFLKFIEETKATRIISPTEQQYVFYQFGGDFQHRITRPLNTLLFWENARLLKDGFRRLLDFLSDLKAKGSAAAAMSKHRRLIRGNGINRAVYTVQQAIGSVSDSLENPNQARKRIGQIFENLVRLLIEKAGVRCESRTVSIKLPTAAEHAMTYELDLVLTPGKALVASETRVLQPNEVVGAVKTTTKDRIDKIFLDKYLMSRLLGREVPVVAIVLHDVQRARKGGSIFGINSTFKSNHFLGYSLALNPLDGVYYVDPRPGMLADPDLAKRISDFARFLAFDLWTLTGG